MDDIYISASACGVPRCSVSRLERDEGNDVYIQSIFCDGEMDM